MRRRYFGWFIIVALVCASCVRDKTPRSDAPSVDRDSGTAPQPTSHTNENACDAAQPRDSRFICPHRLGAIDASTTRAMLDSLFTPVRDDSMSVEGDYMPITVINAGKPDSAVVIWNSERRDKVQSLVKLGAAWRTPEGLGVGSSLDDIVRAIGAVQVMGFGWDYGGTVMLNGTRLENSGIFFRTAPTAGDPAAAKIQGDKPFAANDAGVRALKPVVRAVDIMMQ